MVCKVMILFLGTSLACGLISGAELRDMPFNPDGVIEKATHHPMREGDRILIRDRVYETSFDEDDVVLKLTENKEGAEDSVIPIKDRPEIRDGRVLFGVEGSEIIFEGTPRGLRLEHVAKPLYEQELRIDYSGNVAGLKNEPLLERSSTGEFLIDTNVVYVPASKRQWNCAVAFGGTLYLVVWEDEREGSSYGLYGGRVDQSGVLLDSAGIPIASGRHPSVAFDGTNFLIVWGGSNIFGTRMDQSGNLLDPDGIAICTATRSQGNPSVVFDGTNYFVVWGDERNDPRFRDIYGARVDQAGNVLDPDGIAISLPGYGKSSPEVAFNGTNFLVVWQDNREWFGSYDIYCTPVDQSGNVLNPDGIIIANETQSVGLPKVASDGTNFLVVWDHAESDDADVYGTRTDQSGNILDTARIVISNAVNGQKSPSVAFDGTNYLVVWQDKRSGIDNDIYGTRVDQAGVVLDPDGFAISTATNGQTLSSVVFDGTNYFVVWHDKRFGWDIYGARVDQVGGVIDPDGIIISTAQYAQKSPEIAFDGTNYLVVWTDKRNDQYYPDIYAARVDQLGNVLDPAGIAISTATGSQLDPAIAFDGTNYLVVYWDEYDIYGVRVDQAGNVLDPDGILIAIATETWAEYPAVAFDGTNYLVVWQDWRNYTTDIFGARVDQAGNVLDPGGIGITTTYYDEWDPAVAFDGTNYLVAWVKMGHFGPPYDIWGTRVDQSGNVLDTAGIAIGVGNNVQHNPSIASDGTNFLVVWQDTRNERNVPDIYGARVDPTGNVLDANGIPISTAELDQKYPSVAFDGTNYYVVWQHERSNSWDIYGARVNQSGVVFDHFIASNQSGNQFRPAVASGTADSVLITYSGWTDLINGRPANTMRIWGKFEEYAGYACGDCNGDERVTSADVIYLGTYIYKGGPAPIGEADVNLDTKITIADAIYLGNYVYGGGPGPCQPTLTGTSFKEKAMVR